MPAERTDAGDEPPLRVALVLPESSGGIGTHCRMLAASLAGRGDEVTVLAPRATLARFDFAGVVARTVAVDAAAPGVLRRSRRLRSLIAGLDVVHAHGVRVGALVSLARPESLLRPESLQPVPLVATWHNAPLGGVVRRSAHVALERASARAAAVVLAASEDLLERARRAGARDARFCPVPAPSLAGVVVRGEGEPKPLTLLAVARLHRQKRLDLLVDATAGWADRPDAPRVLVAGDGPERDRLRAHAARVRSPVQLLGARDDVADLLAHATLVVLPSDWEARPLVAQEALRAGVPLIATAVGGVPGLVGDAAVLVPPGDADALAAAIERVLADSALRRRLAVAGPAQAARWPGEEEMTTLVRQVYLDVRSRVS